MTNSYTDLQEQLFWKALADFQKLEPQINGNNLIKAENTAIHTLLIKSFDDFVLQDNLNEKLMQIPDLFEQSATIFAKLLEEALPDLFLTVISKIIDVEFLTLEN